MSEIDCEASKVARSVLYGTEATNAVTKTFNTEFLSPAHQGDLVVMEADVIALGNTSITIQVEAFVWKGPDREKWARICTVRTVFVGLKNGQKCEHGFELLNDGTIRQKEWPLAAAAAIKAFRAAKLTTQVQGEEVKEPSDDLVNLLRRSTGASRMDCKRAIMSKTNGTLDEWIDFLRKYASKI